MNLQLLIKTKMLKNTRIDFNLSDVVFIMIINVKMPTIVCILTIMSLVFYALYEISFITPGPT